MMLSLIALAALVAQLVSAQNFRRPGLPRLPNLPDLPDLPNFPKDPPNPGKLQWKRQADTCPPQVSEMMVKAKREGDPLTIADVSKTLKEATNISCQEILREMPSHLRRNSSDVLAKCNTVKAEMSAVSSTVRSKCQPQALPLANVKSKHAGEVEANLLGQPMCPQGGCLQASAKTVGAPWLAPWWGVCWWVQNYCQNQAAFYAQQVVDMICWFFPCDPITEWILYFIYYQTYYEQCLDFFNC